MEVATLTFSGRAVEPFSPFPFRAFFECVVAHSLRMLISGPPGLLLLFLHVVLSLFETFVFRFLEVPSLPLFVPVGLLRPIPVL